MHSRGAPCQEPSRSPSISSCTGGCTTSARCSNTAATSWGRAMPSHKCWRHSSATVSTAPGQSSASCSSTIRKSCSSTCRTSVRATPIRCSRPSLIARIGLTERQDPYHFGLSLVRRIKECPHQEIGTHTFSHYYCLEDGQTRETFRADLEAARRSAARLGITLRSLVFPRNQFSADYLGICREAGIEAVRGNQQFWLFRSKGESDETLIKQSAGASTIICRSPATTASPRGPTAWGSSTSARVASCCRCRSAPGSLALCVSTASLPP